MRDPARRASWIGLALVVGGFVLLGVAWSDVAPLLEVYLQVPYAVSGAVGGLALLGTGLALLTAQVSRVLGAMEHQENDEALEAVRDLLGALRDRRDG